MAIFEAPPFANEMAVALPMPLDAPEIKTDFPERSALDESMNG